MIRSPFIINSIHREVPCVCTFCHKYTSLCTNKFHCCFFFFERSCITIYRQCVSCQYHQKRFILVTNLSSSSYSSSYSSSSSVAQPLWGSDLVPFADAIAHMRYKHSSFLSYLPTYFPASLPGILSPRATYFSQSPTDKMYSVVASAKALYESLGAMDEAIGAGLPVCLFFNMYCMVPHCCL